MRNTTKIGVSRCLCAIFAATLLSACAGLGQAPSAEEWVAERAQARWDHLIAGEFAAAYGYLSPAQRTAMSATDYERRFLLTKVHWTGARILEVQCEEEVCKARIRLDITVTKPVPQVPSFDHSQTVSEQWILAEGEWWHVPN